MTSLSLARSPRQHNGLTRISQGLAAVRQFGRADDRNGSKGGVVGRPHVRPCRLRLQSGRDLSPSVPCLGRGIECRYRDRAGTDMLTRRHLMALAATPAFAPDFFVREGRAQTPKIDFPNKPVRLVVPVAAGGPTDIVARMLAERLSKTWDQQVVIENKGGAGTNIGNEYVARSDPDGYTVLFATASLAVNTSLYRSLSYDPVADFSPVSLVTELAYFVFVPNSSPAHSMKEFIDYARSRSGQLTIASPGTGSAPFLAEMLFLQMAGLEMTHIPYRGASPAFTDLIPGRVDCYFGSGTLLSYARSGQVRVLATTGAKRDAAAPDVP